MAADFSRAFLEMEKNISAMPNVRRAKVMSFSRGNMLCWEITVDVNDITHFREGTMLSLASMEGTNRYKDKFASDDGGLQLQRTSGGNYLLEMFTIRDTGDETDDLAGDLVTFRIALHASQIRTTDGKRSLDGESVTWSFNQNDLHGRTEKERLLYAETKINDWKPLLISLIVALGARGLICTILVLARKNRRGF